MATTSIADLSMMDMIRQTGKREIEILAQLWLNEIEPTQFIGNVPRFPEYAVTLIVQEPLPLPNMEDRLTINQLYYRTGKGHVWLKKKLNALCAPKEYRKNEWGHVHVCYAPNWIATLKAEANKVPRYRGYRCVNQIMEHKKRGISWVKRRVILLGLKGKPGLDQRSRPQTLYSPSEVKKLSLLMEDEAAMILGLDSQEVREFLATRGITGEDIVGLDEIVRRFYHPRILGLKLPRRSNAQCLPLKKFGIQVGIGEKKAKRVLKDLGISGRCFYSNGGLLGIYYPLKDVPRVREYLGIM